MALSIFDARSGKLKSVKNRVSNASHWGIYHRACNQRPDLVERMYEKIREIIENGDYLGNSGKIPNSTWFGSEILCSWEYRSDWNFFCGNDENVSSALFGQIMWTVMYDDDNHWCTIKTTEANLDREERVYWLLSDDKYQ